MDHHQNLNISSPAKVSIGIRSFLRIHQNFLEFDRTHTSAKDWISANFESNIHSCRYISTCKISSKALHNFLRLLTLLCDLDLGP